MVLSHHPTSILAPTVPTLLPTRPRLVVVYLTLSLCSCCLEQVRTTQQEPPFVLKLKEVLVQEQVVELVE